MTKKAQFIPTADQIQYIRDKWEIPMNKAKRQAIANHIGCTLTQLQLTRRRLKMQMSVSEFKQKYKRELTEDDIAYIKANLFIKSSAEAANKVAERFKISGSHLKTLARERGIQLSELPKPDEPVKRRRSKKQQGDIIKLGRKPKYKPGDLFIKKMMGIDYEVEYINADKWKTIRRITPYSTVSKKIVYKVGDEKVFKSNKKEYLKRFDENGKWVLVKRLTELKPPKSRPCLPAGTRKIRLMKGIETVYETDGKNNWKRIGALHPRPKPIVKPKSNVDSRPIKVQIAPEKKTYIKPVQIKPPVKQYATRMDNENEGRTLRVPKFNTHVFVKYATGETDEQAIERITNQLSNRI